MGLVSNLLSSFYSDKMLTKIILFIMNINSIGQWFMHTILSNSVLDPESTMSYGTAVQIVLALIVTVFSIFLGMYKLDGRDLK